MVRGEGGREQGESEMTPYSVFIVCFVFFDYLFICLLISPTPSVSLCEGSRWLALALGL